MKIIILLIILMLVVVHSVSADKESDELNAAMGALRQEINHISRLRQLQMIKDYVESSPYGVDCNA